MAPMPPNMPQQAAPGAPSGRNIPPQFQQHMQDSPLQEELMRRMSHMTPQQVATLKGSPQVCAVLKQVFPEIGFLFDHLSGGGGAPQPGPAMPEPDADDEMDQMETESAAPPSKMPPQFKRPKTALGQV